MTSRTISGCVHRDGGVASLPRCNGLGSARLTTQEGVGEVGGVVRGVALPANDVERFVAPSLLGDYAFDLIVVSVSVSVHRGRSDRDGNPETRVTRVVGFEERGIEDRVIAGEARG